MNYKNIIKSILSASAIAITFGISLTSIYPLIIFVITYYCFNNLSIENSISNKICFSIFGVFGVLSLYQVNVFNTILESDSIFVMAFKIIITFIGIYYISSLVITQIYKFFDKNHCKNKVVLSAKSVFIISFIILVIIYVPAWMMEYPSNIGADTLDQIKQIYANSYRNHHPFAHTMWLKCLMSFARDINIKIGIASFIQLIINALVFSGVIKLIYEKSGNTVLSILTLFFYAFYSYNAFFSITLVKDVTHATITCLLLMVLIRYYDEQNIRKKYLYLLIFTILSIAFCLFRSNGYYAYLLWLVAAILYCIKKKKYDLTVCSFVAFFFATIIKGPVYFMLGVTNGSFVENLSIPLQQIALTLKWGKTLTNDQYLMLSKIVDVSKLPNAYETFLSDPVKNLFNEFGNVSYLLNHKFEYLKIWFEIGIKYPLPYVRAWVDQVSTFFSPTYYGTSFWWGCSNELGLAASPIMINGIVNENLHLLAYYQHNIPFLGIFHYPAVSTWIVITMFFYALRNNDYRSPMILIPLIGIWLTLMISCPYNLCFRYYYSVVSCIPIVIFYPIFVKKEQEHV